MSFGATTFPSVTLTMARYALFWAFVFPIIMSVALALAFPARGTRPIPVGLAEGPHGDAVGLALGAAGDLAVRPVAPRDEARALREGEVHVVVVPTDPPTYRFDPARDESRAARLAVDRALKRAAGRPEPWTAREEPLLLPGSRYIDWLIPGIVGMNIMSTGMWGIGFSIVQARLRKLLKRLVASPMRKRDYLLAQMLARLVFLAPEVAVPLAFGAFALGMPVRGSLVAVAVVSLVGGLSFTALGLLAASRPRTIEAISGILNLTMLPMWVLSGVFFSTANFPERLQPFIQALPLTSLNDALRAVILEGATVGAVGGELLLLAAWGVVPFLLALRLFRWT
ncbi:MAG: integral membrane transport protein [Acidobacteria bacterium RIFCSPLOWO2_02_FULL_68_18]|nr:MAG: integral membrane transport protein [Acidobacteria bacterium RIFCSPLOWO2_02_FULL_68_18]OFW49300.1 MAG: integral membrane transport protein [Acidobacteria bacterium RIFCSPLOWO2_12_FULL_68_19]